ncbi:MAG: CBS domain-containing protein [Planctomycetota bacterium]|jgi:CBS domain-containing protein
MANVRDLLAIKGNAVHTVGRNVTVLSATQRMNEQKIGAMIVVEKDQVIGMFTERDVLRRVVAEQRDSAMTRVGGVMTRKVISCSPDHELQDVRSIMMEWHIRHLPVVCPKEGLVGMISIGDLNAWSIHNGQVEIEFMKDFVYGRA